MASPVAGGNTAVTLRGQGLRCLEAACDVPLIQPFQASVDTIKNTIEELHSVAAQ
jgi:hypothetical protein